MKLRIGSFVRRASIAVVVTAAAVVLVAPAGASQGGNYYWPSGLNGTRVNIHCNAINQVSGGGGILFIRVQSDFSSSTGLFQVGYHRSLLSGDQCTADGTVNIFVEHKPVGGGFNCTTYFSGNVSDRFGVVAQSTAGFWGAYHNGFLLTPTRNVGFSTGVALTGGEYQGNYTKVDGCFGCSGAIAWQWSSNRGTSYSAITSGSQFDDGGWTIQPAPSPFRINN